MFYALQIRTHILYSHILRNYLGSSCHSHFFANISKARLLTTLLTMINHRDQRMLLHMQIQHVFFAVYISLNKTVHSFNGRWMARFGALSEVVTGDHQIIWATCARLLLCRLRVITHECESHSDFHFVICLYRICKRHNTLCNTLNTCSRSYYSLHASLYTYTYTYSHI